MRVDAVNILKTCLKAGHRWGVPMRSDLPRDGSWVTIQRCQRAGCDRLLTAWSNGVNFTYRLDAYGDVVDRRMLPDFPSSN